MSIERALAKSGSAINPAVLRLGLQLADGVIVGGNARCTAMLTAFRSLIQVGSAESSTYNYQGYSFGYGKVSPSQGCAIYADAFFIVLVRRSRVGRCSVVDS